MSVEEITGIVALVTTVGGILWKGITVLRGKIQKWTEWFKTITKNIDSIMAEFQPNHGSSMKDAMSRIEIRQILTDERLKISFLETGTPILEFDNQGNCVYANKLVKNLLDEDDDALMGLGWLGSIEASQRDEVRKEWLSCIAENREFSMTIRLNHLEPKETHMHASPLRNQEGKLIGYLGILNKRH